MLSLLSLSSIEAYRRRGREKALCLGFLFLGSFVMGLVVFVGLSLGSCIRFCLGLEESKFYRVCFGEK